MIIYPLSVGADFSLEGVCLSRLTNVQCDIKLISARLVKYMLHSTECIYWRIILV